MTSRLVIKGLSIDTPVFMKTNFDICAHYVIIKAMQNEICKDILRLNTHKEIQHLFVIFVDMDLLVKEIIETILIGTGMKGNLIVICVLTRPVVNLT